MPAFDLPVGQLRVYPGKNPRPADFDAYWDRALREMEAMDPQVALIPASFRHPALACFDLYFTGTHGARLHAKYVRPHRISSPVPAVLQFHGYSMASGDWSGLLPMASAGFAVAALDVRGQGGLSEDTGGVRGTTWFGHIVRGLDDPDPDRLLYRDIFLDTALLSRIVAGFPEVDGDRLAAMGGSQGGGLTLACAALADIKLAAPSYPFLSDYQRAWELDLGTRAYSELKEYFRRFDPTHAHEAEIFTKLGYVDVQHLAPRIRAKVHMFTALSDMTCPPSSQFAAYNKITSPKQVTFYPDYGHEWLPDSADQTLMWFVRELL